MQTYLHEEVGYNSRLDALQAAVLSAKLPHLAKWSAKRRENAAYYDAAFAVLSTNAYACYDLERDPEKPASSSPEDAGQKLRAGLEASGRSVGTIKKLDDVLVAAEPVHPAMRVMDHQFARVFSLADIPNAAADAVECRARAIGAPIPDPLPLEYGNAFVMTVRFKTNSGDAPILRVLWRKENGAWRITSYTVEQT